MHSPLIEMTQTMHSLNHRTLHIWPNAASKVHGSNNGVLRREILPGINRPEFNAWREKYWIERARYNE